MIVGVLKEIKTDENRVALTPAGLEVLKHNEHTVLVEKGAGKKKKMLLCKKRLCMA